ncbi:MAG: TonB family protein [Kangiellaceae bacterium]
MSEFLYEFLLFKSIGVFLLLAIVLTLRPIVLKWMNADVAYRLWMIIPLYLLFPVKFIDQNINQPVMTFFSNSGVEVPTFSKLAMSNASSLSGELLLIWGVGFIIALCLFAYRYQTLKRSLRPIEFHFPDELQEKHLNIQPVKTCLVDVPAIFGFINSYLILPKDFKRIPAQQQLIILSHELYHLKRKDHRINILRVLIKCIFWFNPLIYFADKYVEADQELSCDLGVVHSADKFGLRQYGETLLSAISKEVNASLVSQWNYRNLIRVRLKMLKNTTQRKWHNWAATVLAAASIWTASSVTSAEPQYTNSINPVKVVQPRYPREAVEKDIQGYVTFHFNLSKEGAVLDPKIENSEPKGVFDQVAMEAFKKWNFGKSSARKNLVYTMRFQLRQAVVPQYTEGDIASLKSELDKMTLMAKEMEVELAEKKKQTNLTRDDLKLIQSIEQNLGQLNAHKRTIKKEIAQG